MNLSLPFFVLFAALLVVLAETRNPWLFFVLPLAYSMPTARTFFGPVPIYWYDCAAGAILYYLYRTDFWGQYRSATIPWIPIFAIVFLMFGVVAPTVRYGFLPEYGWTYGHFILAWCLFYVGSAVTRPQYYRESVLLAKGMIVSLGWLAVVAVVSWRNVEITQFFNEFFYGDFYNDTGGLGMLTDIRVTEKWAYRAQGPFMNPTNLALFAVLFLAFIIMTKNRLSRFWLASGGLFAAVNVLASVSRQVMIAVCLAGLVYMILTPLVRSIRVIGLGIVLVAGVLLATGGGEVITERFGRVASSGIEEQNVAARLIRGPQRLYDLFSEKPDLLLSGVGLDADKLAGRGVDIGGNETGFVSNSFLLSLYYTGILGFIAYVSLWGWSLWKARNTPGNVRPLALAFTVTGIFLTFTDNTFFKLEAIIAWVLFTLGMVASLSEGSAAQRIAAVRRVLVPAAPRNRRAPALQPIATTASRTEP